MKPEAGTDVPLLVYGGTFDPVHCGHVAVARAARDALAAPLLLLPNRQPPHRGQPLSTPEHRVAMLRLAFAGEPQISVDLRELQREGPSWMVDTLADLRNEYGRQRPLVLVLGADAFLGLPGWHHWQQIGELASVLVASRPGVTLSPLPAELEVGWGPHRVSSPADLRGRPAGCWASFEVPPWPVSSSAVRSSLADGAPPAAALPAAVEDYIRLHGLYRSGHGR